MTTKEQIKADPNGYKHECATRKRLRPLQNALKMLSVEARRTFWEHIDKPLEQQVDSATSAHHSYLSDIRRKEVVERPSDRHQEGYIEAQIKYHKLRSLIEKRREAVAIRRAIEGACRWRDDDE